MTIEGLVHEMAEDARRLAAEGNLDDRGLVLVLDAHQRLLDYFDALLDSDLPFDPGTDPDTVANILTRLP